ncbi:MAG: ATP-dependent DNA ligase [Leucobacter sp.]
MVKQRQTIAVEGKRLSVSSLDKVLYPATGTTKRDIFAYYAEIADVMLPHCRDRAATRKRWPNGVGEDGSGSMFFQKDIGEGTPEWVEVREIQHSDHVNEYPLVNDLATLTWLAQLAALEIHVPQWRFGKGDDQLQPDRLVLDLDPGEGVGLRECAKVARLARDILADIGLESFPVTSGSKGVHLYAALDGTYSSDQASEVARELARSLETDYPDEITSSMKKADRPGKVFIDWSQNNSSKTTVAPYSLRGRVKPTVAAPRTWRELASPHIRQLEYPEVLARVRRRGDPLERLSQGVVTTKPVHDRLSTYRSKRDQKKTPEPVPDDPPSARATDPVFVIQRHEARRLHYDFRLEHDGVLVSWALPKGVPTTSKQNRLAVPTEDHPMEYRHFEGTIPKREYGAGKVEIWDAGSVEIEQWTDTKIVATLTGTKGGGLNGKRRYALFRTKDDAAKPQWMIHLMQDQPRTPPEDHSKASQTQDTHESSLPSFSQTTPPKPMLATRGTEAELAHLSEGDWAFEMKWDGMRALISWDSSRVRIRSRSGADVTVTYPELAGIGAKVVADTVILDGEIVAFDSNGAPSFSTLQKRMNLSQPRDVKRARALVGVSFLAFDVLEINGKDCTALPYRQRRELLTDLIDEERGAGLISVPPAFDGDKDAAITASLEWGLEGVVAKRCESDYRPGVRSTDWLKFPRADAAEVVVIGWRESEAAPDGIASLLVAVPQGDALVYAGRVGTGFSTSERRMILTELSRLERKTASAEVPGTVRRDAHWVTPRRVGEVTFRERTPDGLLRQPVWRGWRPDKRVSDIHQDS